ncbi:MAG: NrfD/PsrC family molybdoenzyme membrane anchor subunit [Bacillota bacterium]
MAVEGTGIEELLRVAVRPMGRPSWRYRALFALLGAAVAWGGVAYAYQLVHGLGVTGLNDNVPWGFYEANIVSFIGFSYGGALTSAILRLIGAGWRTPVTRLAEAVALVTLLIGAAFPIIHLGRPERVWEFLASPRASSPLVWDVVAISTYLAATAVFLYLPLIPDLAACRDWPELGLGRMRRRLVERLAAGWQGLPDQRACLHRALGIVSVLIIPLAVSVHSVLAWAFAVTSRPGWHSTIYGPYFVVAALYAGVALVIVVVGVYRKAYRLERYITEVQLRNLGFILLALGAVYLYFTFAEMLTEGYVAARDTVPIIEALLTGSYSPLFWLVVVGGIVVPILLVAFPLTRNPAGITAAGLLAAGGMWLKRFLIVVPPLVQPPLGEEVAFYAPTWVEISITVAATAAIPFLVMVLFRFVPVLPVWEMVEESERVASERRRLAAARAGAGGAGGGV